MSIERKDVRFKVDADLHAAISVLAEVQQVDIGEWVEMIVQREVIRRVHDANVVAQKTARLGISGNLRESPGAGWK